MTMKLIRYEFRSGFRLLSIIWGALLAMTILMCIMVSVSGLNSYDTMFESAEALMMATTIIRIALWVLYVALFASLVVLTIAIVIARFYRGLLGEEGYLMHTLPVKVWQLITAKGVTATCAVLGSGIVAMISIALISNTGTGMDLMGILGEIAKAIGEKPVLLLIGFECLIIGVISIMKSIYQIYASISIGQLVNRHRILASLGAYIGISMALSMLSGILISLGGMMNINTTLGMWFGQLMQEGGISHFGGTQLILTGVFLVEAIQLAGFHVVAERLLTKRLNLL